jgi:hypothetical protein
MNGEALEHAVRTGPLPDALYVEGLLHRCDRGDDRGSEIEVGASSSRFQEHVGLPVAATSGECDEEPTVIAITPNAEATEAEAEQEGLGSELDLDIRDLPCRALDAIRSDLDLNPKAFERSISLLRYPHSASQLIPKIWVNRGTKPTPTRMGQVYWGVI